MLMDDFKSEIINLNKKNINFPQVRSGHSRNIIIIDLSFPENWNFVLCYYTEMGIIAKLSAPTPAKWHNQPYHMKIPNLPPVE